MNARGYITILQPVRTLVYAAIQGLAAWALLALALQSHPDEARHLFLLILAPLIAGKALLGPLEDLMHREGCALLPGAHRAYAKFHAIAFSAAALALIAANLQWNSGYPLPVAAAIVLSVQSVSLLLDREARDSRRFRRSWRVAVAGVNAVLAVGVMKLPEPAQSVLAWLTFAAALAVALWGFRFCFDLRRVRARGLLPYLNMQSVFLAASGFGRMDRQNLPRKQNPKPGPDWRGGRADDSAWGSIRAMAHVRFGRFKGLMRSLVWLGMVQAPALALVIVISALTGNRTLRLTVADFLMPGDSAGLFDATNPTWAILRMLVLVTWLANLQSLATGPRLSLPVSRRRRATHAWLYSLAAGLAVIAVQFGGTAASLVALDYAVGQPVRYSVFAPLLGLLLVVVAMLPLLQAAVEGSRLLATSFGWSVARIERVAAPIVLISLAVMVPLGLPALYQRLGDLHLTLVLVITALLAAAIHGVVLRASFRSENFATVEPNFRMF